MLAKAILVHGVIGYKFCWLLPSEDHNQGTPAGHESNGTTVRDHWEDMNQLRHQLGTNQLQTSNLLTFPRFPSIWASIIVNAPSSFGMRFKDGIHSLKRLWPIKNNTFRPSFTYGMTLWRSFLMNLLNQQSPPFAA